MSVVGTLLHPIYVHMLGENFPPHLLLYLPLSPAKAFQGAHNQRDPVLIPLAESVHSTVFA